ncbi:MAG: hypothetical protein O3B43_05090 [Chloroflexi bacterium]|nr:hypothetical protein [Chloroflexota bacterium]
MPSKRTSRSSRKSEPRGLGIAALGVALWAFLIYWQGEVTLAGLSRAASALIGLQWDQIRPPYGSLFLDIFLLFAGAIFWFAFFAHFVVPLRRPSDAIQMFKAMSRSLLGNPPESLYLRNGLRTASSKTDNSTPSQILFLDSASAAVLRTDSSYTRAIGPGLNFTQRGERIAGTLDLRVQRRALGPQPDEDPFAPRGLDESTASQQGRLLRRQETSGLTRDSIEVVPRLEVDFRIEGRARKNGNPYPFQAEFVWRAVASEGIAPQSPSDARARQVAWDWLPIHLTVDVWREYLRKFSLQELFDPSSQAQNANNRTKPTSGLEELLLMVNQRLRESLVPEKPGAKRKVSSPEYQLLRNRGLRVHEVRLRELHLDAARDETRLVNEWSESWELRAIQANAETSRRSAEKQRLGQQAAAAEFVRQVSGGLHERLNHIESEGLAPPDEKESLQLLLDGSKRGAARLPGLKTQLSGHLNRIADWLNGAADG